MVGTEDVTAALAGCYGYTDDQAESLVRTTSDRLPELFADHTEPDVVAYIVHGWLSLPTI
jgi:hypothetical protein